MFQEMDRSAGNILGFKVSGKLADSDYKTLTPIIDETTARFGKVRLLMLMDEFEGITLHAAWDDFVFMLKHRDAIERLALVGEDRWERWLAKLGRPFIKGETEYFDKAQLDEAWQWLHADTEPQRAA